MGGESRLAYHHPIAIMFVFQLSDARFACYLQPPPNERNRLSIYNTTVTITIRMVLSRPVPRFFFTFLRTLLRHPEPRRVNYGDRQLNA